jgi:superfamily II DNA or RNA helicase
MRFAFDRGTIVLRDLPADVAAGLPGIAWDDRVGAHRVTASAWPDIRDRLAAEGFAGEGSPGLAPLPFPARAPELRAYQRAAVETWLACGRRGVIVLPTGAGKTRVALAAIAATGLPTLVLVPTRVLLAQWAEALRSVCDARIGRLGDGERSVESITVATYASAWRHAAGLGDRFGLVIVDEAHHVGGALRVEPLLMSLAPFRLGLTALAPGPRAGASLDELVGPVVFSLGMRDLAGSLAPIRLVGIGLDFTPEERASWMGDMTQFRAELSRNALDVFGRRWGAVRMSLARSEAGRKALSARRRASSLAAFTISKSVVLAAILERHAGDRVIVFTRDNVTAFRIAKEHLVPAVTCEMGAAERREVFDAFGRGEVRALVSARVLDEGVDLPEAAIAVIVGAGRAERQHVQRVGRILRPVPGKRAILYDLFQIEGGDTARAARRRRAIAP